MHCVGDLIQMMLPMTARAETLKDERPGYQQFKVHTPTYSIERCVDTFISVMLYPDITGLLGYWYACMQAEAGKLRS